MDGIPLIVQGSEAPCFRGTLATDRTLACASNCGQTLIENYDPEQYIRVGIKCFRCGGETWTPALPNGEVLAALVVSLGERGRFRFDSTLEVPPQIIFTCDEEIRREIELTAPRNDSTPFTLSLPGLKELTDRYDDISGGRFQLQRKIIERTGDSELRNLPFAWAAAHLEKCITENYVNLYRADTNTALSWLRMFSHVVSTWGHHRRFHTVARGVGEPNSFLHHIALLIAAAYFYKAGNKIGLALEDKVGQPNPDLYIRGGPYVKIYLEVKTPQSLRWTSNGPPSADGIDIAVKECVKKSNGQINRNHPGVLIIYSCFHFPGYPEILERAIQKAVRSRGRHHKSLGAVIGMSPLHGNHIANGLINREIAFSFTTTLNDYYTGHFPILTNQPLL